MDDNVLRYRPTYPLTEYEQQMLELFVIGGMNRQEIAEILELDMSLEELRSWLRWEPGAAARADYWRRSVEQSELPPVPKEHLEVLEPLTPQQLLLCCREAHRDRRQHIRTEHPDEAAAPNLDHLIESILEHLLEEIADPRKAAAGREFRRRSMGIHEEEDVDRREGLRSLASLMASEYWAHVTTGRVAPRGSSDEYLTELARRVSR